MAELAELLETFVKKNQFSGKGPLCVALVITHNAKQLRFPLNPNHLLTESGGQVTGLGKASVQAILRNFNIERVLAEEGGRTSRGSVGNMRKYVEFLNDLEKQKIIDLDSIEKWWIEKVLVFFAGKPFILRFDPSKSIRVVIRDLLGQAQERQKESPGATFTGTVMQHLVGAKLDLILGGEIEHHGASVADSVSGREADFLVEDVAIHVTAAPGEALIRKCGLNLDNGLRPIVITTKKGLGLAEGLAEQKEIADRVDVFEIEQLIAGNLYEQSKFANSERRTTASELISKYNQIVSDCETNPSLLIEFRI